ncbi:membrane protein insertase YidC [Streptococcus oralis subsp. tigurinus]|uniref:membrane protein insertase YidC n=1 Tax=Streptococcus oralis TaxID=1303 RepID=UPI001874080D|nr:membrane protein insertase YidC [Streptococcus oralis]MBS9401831.1 membrane protein insertase YidC [Streptococcus oralis]MCY7079816.1 membrane protein insertase YidC [Streptococcus oralis]
MKKKLQLTSLLSLSLFIMTACATNGTASDITADSTDFWSKFVYFFAEIIRFLSFDISIGVGIILFTILIRTILLPVFQTQMVASRKMQEAQPRIKALREQYPGRDMESRTKLDQEMRKVYKELGIKHSSSLWPILIQMPILLALFQALSRVDFLKTGHFLWINLGGVDTSFVLPILAAVFTFLSSWLSNKALSEKSGATTGMMYGMPVLIFVFAISAPSGVALYWAVSNAYQVLQTYFLNNPFKIIAEREAVAQAEKDLEGKKRRALKKAQKKKK